MIVLPWPGESACTTPRAKAIASEMRIASGVRSWTSTRTARSSPIPPGTAATGLPAAAGAGAEPATGDASGGVHGASVGPPGVAATEIERMSSGWVNRSVG